LLVVATIWWLVFWTALGLCVGSFLNVVIYRVPRDQSIRDPRWSHCPDCHARIRWYDNLPVISFALLGGRCRRCRKPISARYPLVEMLTALVVLVLLDVFFVAGGRVGLSDGIGLTWRLAEDWPIFLAHIVLFACLLAMAAIDLREYWVDIRFTTVATWFGFILHALWTPRHSLGGPSHPGWLRPGDATAAGALGALVGLGLVWAWCRGRRDQEESLHAAAEGEEAEVPGEPEPVGRTTDAGGGVESVGVSDPGEAGEVADEAGDVGEVPAELTVAVKPPSRTWGLGGAMVVGLLLVAVAVSMGLSANSGSAMAAPPWRSLVPLVLFFLLILAEGAVPRPADRHIMEAIEAERLSARRMVLSEFVWLLPAIVLGAVAVWLELSGPGGWRLGDPLHWRVGQNWQPVYGLATAAAGYVIGGGIGWAMRIVFTLLFGKEAFGLGDIHIMAAAGCVAGWPVVLLAFMVTIFVALAAWLITLPFKRTRAIPLIPWLALGYAAVVVHYEWMLGVGPIRNALEVINMLFLDKSQAVALGVLP